MRICGGKYRGRKLNTPDGDHIRPTSDKVRQAIFNMLESRGLVQDARVIDGFCGTGALGLEALSRGAHSCLFMDKDKRSIAVCKDNIIALDVVTQSKTVCIDTTKVKTIPNISEPADLVFLDPPYRLDMISQAINALTEANLVNDETSYVLEAERQFVIQEAGFVLEKEKTYKNTKVMIVRKQSDVR